MKDLLRNAAFLLALFVVSCTQPVQFKVLQFNIWQEGTVVKDGYEAIVEEIIRTDADFITLSEVRNYKDTRFCDRIVQSLKEKGKIYYSFYSYDSGILSKYPIEDSVTVFPEKDDHGSIYKAVADMNGQKVAVYTAHLDYRNCALYLPRGYSGTTWDKLDSVVTDLDTILADNMASQRDDAIRLFVKDAQQEIERGSIVLLGGDFNEPSHLDWTEATKDLFDHQGLVIPWTVTSLLEEGGYVDAYRELYPNPVSHPGFTFPADCPHVDIKKLAWSPDADDRDRIDFVFYQPFAGLKLKDMQILGPKGSVVYGKREEEQTQDPFLLPLNVWPTDHKALLATFELQQ
ncbi:endonuclease/exonuclease/phosphatase family protein [Rapidithrix thailandica]|uniref:Endonuclease/exonuclease/phosphatase family protein n=1 Tax=Rapidithrix thailandica TaxID=413964 RepID=A0AAW9S7R6_9BACT